MATTYGSSQDQNHGRKLSARRSQPGQRLHSRRLQRRSADDRQAAEEFATNEILPNAEKIEHKDWAVTRELLQEGQRDGPDQRRRSRRVRRLGDGQGLVRHHRRPHGQVRQLHRDAWARTAGIGTLPIVYFGTEEQKKKYLPRLATARSIGAYALSESTSGSDALNCRTRAVLSPDGKHYILNGEKMWITNAHFADLFTVFAKVDGEKFTAFLVEKDFPGFSVGAEEKKMGIRGSSTCAAHPERLQGAGGERAGRDRQRAHHRLQHPERRPLQAGRELRRRRAHFAAARHRLRQGAQGLRQEHRRLRPDPRKAGADGGRHLRRRVDGLSHRRHDGHGAVRRSSTNPETMRKAIEEYAVECSIIKVWRSEMLDIVVDETVQIYGGYGFVEEYPAERAYRDSRVNRIFEGTNEINRLIITGWLLKRAMSGQLALLPAIKKMMDEVMAGPIGRRTRRHAGRRAQAGGERQEAGHAGGRRGFAEVHAEAGRSAGDHGRHRRHGDRDLCHGFRPAARAQVRRGQRRSRRPRWSSP